ncbi:cytochrome b subunit of the bc complex [Candidatus Scalindua japonica]|uniref:Cytochrome b subunit of the bc complex n=1 Tax=Candidatus Scalindua japonica TaxID=1284222 RepID=A0A286U2T1_9BACT|nr:cytochrome C [Candidatus Scalindua japonica]GAX62443.1 cytochrome b subunit of the bc complex [Candidatus Scalindua japonica]
MSNIIHILFLKDNEVIALFGIAVFFFAVVAFREAIKNDRLQKQGKWPPEGQSGKDKVLTWPFLVRKEFLVAIFVTAGLLVWGVLRNAPLEEFADPNITPNPSKAPWYFLGLQEMLVYFDPWIAGVLFPLLIIVGLMAIPYIDINPKGSGYYTIRERKFAVSVFSFGFLFLWVILIVVGVFFRGTGWLWYWPWQEWVPHTIVAETNYDFTQFLGIDSRSVSGSITGGSVVTLYYLLGMVIPYVVMKARNSKNLQKLGLIRYITVSFLFWSMIGLPIKMFLRLIFHMKYIWVTPWFNI